MIEIQLTQGKVALVDDEDFERINRHKWYANRMGRSFYGAKNYEYRFRDGPKRSVSVYMHRLIMRAPRGMVVDHLDGNGLNNQKSNLRICTRGQNATRQKPQRNTSSKYKGVSWNSEKYKWEAYVTLNKIRKKLGYFVNEDDAARAYNDAAAELHGEFALLNEIK